MKALRYILPLIVIAIVIGIWIWQYNTPEGLEQRDMVKGLLIIAAAILSIFRRPRTLSVTQIPSYRKAYAEFVEDAFSTDSKLEHKFFDAVHDYNRNRLSRALKKLENLRQECTNSADIRAISVFTALCLDDMRLYDKAMEQYRYALNIRPNSTLYSNIGLCHIRLGQFSEAEVAFRNAIAMDERNPYPLNNLSAMFFRQGDYTQALDYALQAIQIDANMPHALSTAAICYGLLGDTEQYELYYRRAVTAGCDGKTIKSTVAKLNPHS